MSGYTQCACRDCFEIAISDEETLPDLCWECEAAGCSEDGDCECCREDAYMSEDWVSEEAS